MLARAEKKEMSDDDAKELGKQAVNKGGNAYIDELPVSFYPTQHACTLSCAALRIQCRPEFCCMLQPIPRSEVSPVSS